MSAFIHLREAQAYDSVAAHLLDYIAELEGMVDRVPQGLDAPPPALDGWRIWSPVTIMTETGNPRWRRLTLDSWRDGQRRFISVARHYKAFLLVLSRPPRRQPRLELLEGQGER